MGRREVDKRTLHVLLEAVRGAEDRLRDYYRQMQAEHVDVPDAFRAQYGGARRLKDYLTRSEDTFRAPMQLFLSDEDENLLASCLVDGLPEIDMRLASTRTKDEDKSWLEDQRQLLSVLARGFMTEPLAPLLCADPVSRQTPSVKALSALIPAHSKSMPLGDIRVGKTEEEEPAPESAPNGFDPVTGRPRASARESQQSSYPSLYPQPAPSGPTPDSPQQGQQPPPGYPQNVPPGYAQPQAPAMQPPPAGYGQPPPMGQPGVLPPGYAAPQPYPVQPQYPPQQMPPQQMPPQPYPGQQQMPQQPMPQQYPAGAPQGFYPGTSSGTAPYAPAQQPPPMPAPQQPGDAGGGTNAQDFESGLQILRDPFAAAMTPPAAEPARPIVAPAKRVTEGIVFLFDPNLVRDHRVRAQIRLDLQDLARAQANDDLRLSLVHLGSLLEGLLLDHALERRKELELAEAPDVWDFHTLAVRLLGPGLEPGQEPVMGLLHACRRLLRPSCQVVHPIIATGAMVSDAVAFLRWALIQLGYQHDERTQVQGAQVDGHARAGSGGLPSLSGIWRATRIEGEEPA